MISHVAAYGFTATTFFVIDIVWLAVIARRFYVDNLGHLLLEKPNLAASGAFYLVYVFGIVVFAVVPALRSESAISALMYGALFGLCAYATYDVTNYATLRNWPLNVSIVDTLWGTGITSLSALAGYLGTRSVMT